MTAMEQKAMAPDSAHPNTYPRRSRSFALRSFRKSAAAEAPPPPSSAAAGPRKATAWPWLRRAEVKAAAQSDHRPPPASHEAAASAPPAAAVSNTGNGTGVGGGALPHLTPPSSGPPTPLYDEVELSGLTSQMADFLQRLQKKQKQDDQQKPAAAPTDQKSAPPRHPSSSVEEAAAVRRSISSCTGFGFNHGVHGPISVLQRLLRKVLPGSHHSSGVGNSAMEQPSGEPDSGDLRHHYHHYIHHHHYHYHFDPANPSLEEGSFPLRSRRHSESGDIRSRIPPIICEDDADDKEDSEGKSPLGAFLARRRRNSDSIFAERYGSMKATHNSVSGERKRFSRRYNSERYVSKADTGGGDEELWKSTELKSRRRRHSTESWRAGYPSNSALRAMEEAAMAAAAKGASGPQKLGELKGDLGNGHELKAGMTRRRSASFVDSCRRAEVLNENSRRDGSLLRPPSPASARSRGGQAHTTYSLSSQFPLR